MNIISINKIIQKNKEKKEQRDLDIKASVEILVKCLFLLNMNDLEELKSLKKDINLKIKELKKL